MCGIFGYISRSGESLSKETLVDMGQVISHRGPDGNGIYSNNGVAIGNQRLSIIDIEGGQQPFVSDNGKIVVVQNGEIYNHIELANDLKKTGYACRTTSDTEVLLRLYEREGINFVSKLNGMFSIAIYDENLDALFIIRDRVGVKPLYVYDDGDKVVFASEIKSILKANVPRILDESSLHYFLTYNFVPLPHTIFKDIKHLMPGHIMCITKSETKITQWWNLSNQKVEERSEEEWIELFNETFSEAVRLRLRADVPFGAFLSGGIDSSSVVGLMSRHMNQPVKTFSIGFDDPRFDESYFAQLASDRFGTDHIMEKMDVNMIDLWPLVTYHCDQPHGDVSFMPTYRVSQLAVEHVKMVLTGDGGDELFAGYDKYKNFFTDGVNNLTEPEFQKAYFNNISLFTDEHINQLYTPNFQEKIKNINSFEIIEKLFEEASHMDRINQALYIDTKMLLPGNNLVKPDRMGMAVSLEARTPFLDVNMVELAFRIPGALKLKNNETKYIYKKAVTPLLGEELVYRKKQMFTVPVGEWFKSSLAEYVDKKLLNGQLIKREIMNANQIKELIISHQKGIKNYTREIRALIAIENWFEEFLM